MSKKLKAFAVTIFIATMFLGTVTAYSNENVNSETEKQKIYKNYETVITAYSNILTDSENKDIETDVTLTNNLINRSVPVILCIDNVPRLVKTEAETVGEFLEEQGKTLGATLTVENQKNETKITSNMIINAVVHKEVIYKITEKLQYETVQKPNSLMPKGQKKVVKKGQEGLVQITFKDTYKGNQIINSEEVSSVVLKEATNEIVEYGTLEKTYVETLAGDFSYKSAINVTATGYTRFDPGCNGITATGAKATKGAIAVDPRVIPMGTKIYVPGYGVGIASDTGGAIKGNKIDLCFDSVQEAKVWGRKSVVAYILE